MDHSTRRYFAACLLPLRKIHRSLGLENRRNIKSFGYYFAVTGAVFLYAVVFTGYETVRGVSRDIGHTARNIRDVIGVGRDIANFLKRGIRIILLIVVLLSAAERTYAQVTTTANRQASRETFFNRVSDWFATVGKSEQEEILIRKNRRAQRKTARAKKEIQSRRKEIAQRKGALQAGK